MTLYARWLPLFIALTGCAHTGVVGTDEAGVDASIDVSSTFADASMTTGSIRVSPATSSVEIDDGQVSGKSVAFTAEQLQGDGTWTSVTSSCSWSLANVDIGLMSGSTFQPSGDAGGQTKVGCLIGSELGSAQLTVTLIDKVDPSNVDTGSKAALLGATTPDPSVSSLSYPYDKTVFPRGLSAAPEIMWNAPTSSDIYAFVYGEPYAKVIAYFTAPQPGRFLLPLAEWNKLAASNPDGKLTLTTYRLANGAGGTAYVGPSQTWTMSRASLKGTAYYYRVTDLNVGDIVRMPFQQAPQVFLDKNSSNGYCTGCHAIAAKADVLAAGMTFNVWGGAFTKSTGVSTWEDSKVQTGFRAVSADGKVVASLNAWGAGQYFGSALYFLDATTGQQISGAPSYGLTSTPAFSSSGKLFAFSVRQADNYATYGGQHLHDQFCGACDIALADYDTTTHNTSSPRTIVAGKGSQCNVFPNTTPDDARVAFERGISSQNRWSSTVGCENAQGANKASLWIVNADGTNAIELANASASNGDVGDRLHSFRPIFSPVVQGGYFWMMFTSMRTYGNRLTATTEYDQNYCQNDNFSDCRHQQVWVAAVDVATGTIDPSHPAFWLPGQDPVLENFDAQWSLDACKANGSTCEAGFECCGGTCQEVNGQKVCNAPSGCGGDGDVCTTSAQCCTGAQCIGGVCSIVVN